jgi:DNA gyrase/topoisomerase IV subunit A
MRLAKLTGLEIDKLEAELKEVRATIKELKGILSSKPKRMAILKEEMDEVAGTYGDDRRTEIVADQGEFTVEDLIAEEDMVITVSHSGYIKRIPITTYKRQRRGGRGLNARLSDVLQQQGPGLLAEGARDSAGRARSTGQADRQLHRHQARRANCGPGTGSGIHRR